MSKLTPKNLTAKRVAAKQFLHRADGNPPSTLPDSAISNCYPGLEFDFRNVWRRIFVGIVMHEADNYVLAIEDAQYQSLLHCRLLKVDGHDMTVALRGPEVKPGAWFMEWSNSLSRVLAKAGEQLECVFTAEPSDEQRLPTYDRTQTVQLRIRNFFENDQPVISRELLEPGDLTQSLCSPWQNDYRECACYYWASSRPDYVNVEAGMDGLSVGENWMQRRTPDTPPNERVYKPDARNDFEVFFSYEDLFREWERVLQFEVSGFDQGEK
ncbi:MAG: hypothetical protein ACXWH7_07915 [Thermoanaerobaculia bacterium]